MTRECIDFVREHLHDDTARLLLSAARYPAIDMPLAVNQIEGLRMAGEKWPTLMDNEEYLFPPRLNREQASSEVTAHYKASLIAHHSIADLTGGMGVDTLAFAKEATHVDYVERDAALCSLMEHNCRALGVSNVSVHCADSMAWLATQEPYDLIYLDPARRSASGRKVSAFEDCTPDLLQHLDLLRSKARRLLVKASPMIDLRRATEQLGAVSEVHIIAVKGECKEVLFLCESTHDGQAVVHCTDLKDLKDFKDLKVFSFTISEEQTAAALYSDAVGRYLYDPHAALRKGGCFRLLSQRYGLPLLASNTHLYTSPTLLPDFPGRIFEVLQEVPLNRKAVKAALPDGKAHVVVRNFPEEAAVLQRQLGLKEGGDLFLIAATVGTRRTALLCRQA
ncbi:MAG: SAM-dependent methyltransferase [Bacteroidales bacterium]|nr:SAM-dependent methyltransferase [Bacteroidales bacterium]